MNPDQMDAEIEQAIMKAPVAVKPVGVPGMNVTQEELQETLEKVEI